MVTQTPATREKTKTMQGLSPQGGGKRQTIHGTCVHMVYVEKIMMVIISVKISNWWYNEIVVPFSYVPIRNYYYFIRAATYLPNRNFLARWGNIVVLRNEFAQRRQAAQHEFVLFLNVCVLNFALLVC